MTISNTRCILSCDGGGIRGLVTAVMLERLETKLKAHNPTQKLRDYFDLIAGTSTGSLIACGISRGYDASTIKELYLSKGLVIFPKFDEVAWGLVTRLRPGYSQPIYNGEGLEKVLQENFGNDRFASLPVPTLVTSYDAYNRRAVVMVNTDPTVAEIPIWEVCRASAAAPTAFPAHLITDPTFIAATEQSGCFVPRDRDGRKVIPLMDGGMFANNPALCAVIDRLRQIDRPAGTELIVASLGTGQNVKEIGVEAAREWGILEWLSPRKGLPLLDTLFDGSSDVVDHAIRGLMPECHYFRFQPTLEADLPAFKAGSHNLSRLIEASDRFLSSPAIEQKLEQLAALLLARQPVQVTAPIMAVNE